MKYRYVLVKPDYVDGEYYYLDKEEKRIEAGRFVEVPFGPENTLMTGVVVGTYEYEDTDELPYPLEEMKTVVKVMNPEEEEKYLADLQLHKLAEIREEDDPEEMYQWAFDQVDKHLNSKPDSRIMEEVLNILKTGIDEGNTMAMVKMGVLYSMGKWVYRNQNEALRFFKIAADSGDLEATRGLARYYLETIGENPGNAFTAYALLTECALIHGDMESVMILGDMYSEGIGTRVSMQTAFNLYTRCMTEMYHNQDVPPYLASLLLYRLGMCFKNGDGTEKNLHIAYESLMTAKTKIFLGSMDNRDELLSDISKALAEIETELNSERKRPE